MPETQTVEPASTGVEVMGPEFLGLPSTSAPEPKATVEPKVEPSVEAVEPQKEVAEGAEEKAEVPTKLWASQYKTPEELEKVFLEKQKSYDASSRESVRLVKVNEQLSAQLEEALNKAAMAEIKAQLGTLKEKSPEELAEMSESEKIRYELQMRDRQQLQKELESKQKAEDERIDADNQLVDQALAHIASDPVTFPNYESLKPVMASFLKEEPKLNGCGIPKMPYFMYWAARGMDAHTKELEAAKKVEESKTVAAKKAQSDASRSGAQAATGNKVTGPVGKTWGDGFADTIKGAERKPIF